MSNLSSDFGVKGIRVHKIFTMMLAGWTRSRDMDRQAFLWIFDYSLVGKQFRARRAHAAYKGPSKAKRRPFLLNFISYIIVVKIASLVIV